MRAVIVCAVLIVAVPLLSSCGLLILLALPPDSQGCNPVKIQFSQNNPDAVFRGVWTGTVEDYPGTGDTRDLTLNVSAVLVDEGEYSVTGSFQLGSVDSRTFTGTVMGGCAERYVTTSSGAALSMDTVPHDEGLSTEQATPPPEPPMVDFTGEARDASGTLLWAVSASWQAEDLTEGRVGVELVSETDNFSSFVRLTRTNSP